MLILNQVCLWLLCTPRGHQTENTGGHGDHDPGRYYPVGAEGYGAVDGESIIIGTTPEDIANKSIRVLQNKRCIPKLPTMPGIW